VRFVIIGGIAERILGSPRTTRDFDICPAMSKANLERLAAMLNEVEAIWRPPGMKDTRFPTAERWNARSFGSQTGFTLLTKFGNSDIWPRPHGTGGYDDLIENAVEIEIGGLKAKVVHLEDSMRIKRSIGGPKYLGSSLSCARYSDNDAHRASTSRALYGSVRIRTRGMRPRGTSGSRNHPRTGSE
jgi:hypothetical protein